MASAPKPTSITIPVTNLIVQQDKDFFKDRQREIEYEMPKGRVFRGDPKKRGPYSPPSGGGGGA